MQPEPTVHVVDDDGEVRDSIRCLIEALRLPVRVFASSAEFRTYYRRGYPGCLILDVRMPRQSGLELYSEMVREGLRLPAIFITGHADVSTAVAAMKTGAIEFLEKPFDGDALSTLVRRALEFDAQWRRRESEFVAFDQRLQRLTDRDRETLELIIAGKSNKSMATRFFISERAVEMRRAGIMKKLQVRSVAELLDVAITHRVLSEVRHAADQRPFASD